MSHCTTWHVRIDLVDDGTELVARAKLIGSPLAITRQPSAQPHDQCLTGCGDSEYLSVWRPLEELVPILTGALSMEHGAHDPGGFREPVNDR
jgi:hypothetical protein